MNIGFFALAVAGILAVIALVCWLNPAPAPRRDNSNIDYSKIYAAMSPRDL